MTEALAVDKLKAEQGAFERLCDRLSREDFEVLLPIFVGLRAELKLRTDLFVRYGGCTETCNSRRDYFVDYPCDCGFEALEAADYDQH